MNPASANGRADRGPTSAAGVDPVRMTALLAAELPPAVARRLVGSARLAPRLEGVLRHRLGLPAAGPPVAGDPVARAVLGLDAEGLRRAADRAGAIWHGRRLRTLLEASALLPVLDLVEEGYAAAVAHADLVPESLAAPPAAADDPATALRRDGLRCLAAWCAAQPSVIGAEVRLRLPPSPDLDGPVGAAHRDHGPRVLACAVADFRRHDSTGDPWPKP